MQNEPHIPSMPTESGLSGRSGRPLRGLRAAAAVLMAAGAVCLVVATSASAATVGATATIATPGSLAELDSGGSTTLFTVTLPHLAACSGDTATGGYHIYSYLVPKGTNLTTLNYLTGPPTGTYGMVDNGNNYYGAVNTAIGTGQIVSIPNNLEWEPLVTEGVTVATLTGGANKGVWEGGLLCAKSTGVVTDNWNTQITFATSTTDPNGFTWSAVPGEVTTTTTTTTTTGGGGATTTTAASGDTTTTTTASDGATTTTAAVAGVTAAGTSGGSSSDGSGTDGSTGSTGTTSGNLAFTGVPVWKFAGAGLLAVGIGFMLLGWGYDRRRRVTRAVHGSPW